MIPFIADLRERAARTNKKIALPEGHDVRTIRAAAEIVETGLARPVVLGKAAEVEAAAKEAGVSLSSIPTLDPTTSEKAQSYAQLWFQRRKHKGMTYEMAREMVSDPLLWGDLMVLAGDAGGCVCGGVEFRATGRVMFNALCHCRACSRALRRPAAQAAWSQIESAAVEPSIQAIT